MKISQTALLVSVAAMAACASPKARIMSLDGGVNKVVVRDSNRSDAEEAAANAAEKHCQAEGKKAIFVGENTQVAGTSSTQSNVAKTSRSINVLNQNRSRNLAARANARTSNAPSIEQIGQVGEIMTADRNEFQTDMTFKCQ